MDIKICTVGPLETNCYLIQNKENSLLIDPGDEPEKIKKMVLDNSTQLLAIICTHGHYDHIGAVAQLKRELKVPVWVHEAEKEVVEWTFEMYGVERFDVDRWLKNGKTVSSQWAAASSGEKEQSFNKEENVSRVNLNRSLEVLHTPGHSPGSICLFNDEIVFTGDTVFAGGYLGRTDFPGGSQEQMEVSAKKVLALPENLVVYAGHGPSSSIGKEKSFHSR